MRYKRYITLSFQLELHSTAHSDAIGRDHREDKAPAAKLMSRVVGQWTSCSFTRIEVMNKPVVWACIGDLYPSSASVQMVNYVLDV